MTYKEQDEIPSIDDVREDIRAGRIKILPPQEWFESLKNQGVLFLNVYLTTKVGASKAHRCIWKPFSEALIEYIATQKKDLYWFLWGKETLMMKSKLTETLNVPEKRVLWSKHPTNGEKQYDEDKYCFFKNDCFKNTREEIDWLGKR